MTIGGLLKAAEAAGAVKDYRLLCEEDRLAIKLMVGEYIILDGTGRSVSAFRAKVMRGRDEDAKTSYAAAAVNEWVAILLANGFKVKVGLGLCVRLG